MQHRAQCWNGAKFIQDLLRSIGAENKLAQVLPGKNPIVIGRLGWDPALPTITLHGHYDVMVQLATVPAIPTFCSCFLSLVDHGSDLECVTYLQPADSPDWSSDPFHLTGEDGYVYGRGCVCSRRYWCDVPPQSASCVNSASDNKGPVLAAIYAVALSQRPHIPFGGMMDLGKYALTALTCTGTLSIMNHVLLFAESPPLS